MNEVSGVVLEAYNQYLLERDGHETWMDQDQIDFRKQWKRRHGRIKGANQAYKRHLVRKRRKINKRINK